MIDSAEKMMLAASITAAWLSSGHTRTGADDAAAVLVGVHGVLVGAQEQALAAAPALADDKRPTAASVRKSLASPDHIVSFIDGRSYRTLKRHLGKHGMTPDQYRERYGLPADYPMIAPSYRAARSEISKRPRASRSPDTKVQTTPAAVPDDTNKRSGRRGKTIAEAKAAARAHLGSE